MLSPAQGLALVLARFLPTAGVLIGLMRRGVLGEAVIPACVLLAVANPFFVVGARDPARRWRRTPRGITTNVGLPS